MLGTEVCEPFNEKLDIQYTVFYQFCLFLDTTVGYLNAESDSNENINYAIENSVLDYVNVDATNGRLFTEAPWDFEVCHVKNYVIC